MGARRSRSVGLAVAGLAALACACGPPRQPPGHPYAHRPSLAGLDTSPLRGRRILIDPGHGGRFDGAQGVLRTREADVNLGVALYLWGLLRDANADVHLTRHSDRDLLGERSGTPRDDLAARVHAIDSLAPEVFLSLHHNSNTRLDRERNAIETYYKLDDDGPCFDLGRAIAAHLARHLGIGDAHLLPGNYYVLRGATTAAVLGEASYLSNPKIESELRLAEKQLLEAEAYFLGLLDYFAHGSAAIDKLVPAGDTLQAGTALRFGIAEPVDPLTVEVRADGAPLPAWLDGSTSEIVTRGDLPPGTHEVHVRARLARGNAARPWHGRIVVQAAAARGVLAQQPDPAAPGSRVRLALAVQDASGRGVGDGLPVRLSGVGLELLEAEPATRAGRVLAIGRVRGSGARLQVLAGALATEIPLRVASPAARLSFVRCADARDGRAVPDAFAIGGVDASDRGGYLGLGVAADTLQVERQGYRPWRGVVPADSTVRLVPLYDGRLVDAAIALDPGGDGGESAIPGTGVVPADASFEVCRLLGDLLSAGGAEVTTTRARFDAASGLERVRRAGRVLPDWYVRVEIVPASPARVWHYSGSAPGERLATSLATWLVRRSGGTVTVQSDTRFLLQQTPCPAVVVQLPFEAARTLGGARLCAYALFVGLRCALDGQAAERPPLVGRVASPAAGALVSLDAAAVLPVASDGSFRFECVEPGAHRLRVHGALPAEIEVQVAGDDTTRVRIGPERR